MKKKNIIILILILLMTSSCVKTSKDNMYISFIVTYNTANKKELYSEIAYIDLKDNVVKMLGNLDFFM